MIYCATKNRNVDFRECANCEDGCNSFEDRHEVKKEKMLDAKKRAKQELAGRRFNG
jgi:hypothetical protein